MRPCPAGRGGADVCKSRATQPPKRGSKKNWGQLWGHVIFSIMKKSFMFIVLLAYFVFPRRISLSHTPAWPRAVRALCFPRISYLDKNFFYISFYIKGGCVHEHA